VTRHQEVSAAPVVRLDLMAAVRHLLGRDQGRPATGEVAS
jgi:hypothetical protein